MSQLSCPIDLIIILRVKIKVIIARENAQSMCAFKQCSILFIDNQTLIILFVVFIKSLHKRWRFSIKIPWAEKIPENVQPKLEKDCEKPCETRH